MGKSKILVERWFIFIVGLVMGVLINKIFFKKYFNGPYLKIEPPLLNIGELKPGQKLKYTITLKNDGDMPLIIKKIRKSCSSCIGIKINKNIILPKRSEKVEIFITLSERYPLNTRNFKDFIVFHTNEKNPSFKIFKIEGIIKPLFEIRPPVLNLGIIQIEELPIEEKVFIGEVDGDIQIISNFYKGNLPLSLNIKREKNILRIILNDSNFIGPINGELKISFLQKSNFSIVIPILGKIIGDVYATPEEINFLFTPNLNINNQLTILLHFRKNVQYKIKNISLNPPELKKFILVEKKQIRRENLL